MRTVTRGLRRLLWLLRRCAMHCVIGLSASSGTVAPQLADPWSATFWTMDPWPADTPPPRLPPGHPERIPDAPLSTAELELWARLTG